MLDSATHESTMGESNDAMLNGAFKVLGAVCVLDNVVVHWMLELHRAVPGSCALQVEWALVILGALLFAIGLRRALHAGH